MTVQIELCEETTLAVLTGKPFLALMDFHMLIQVCFLSERVGTLREGAMVGPLLGVDPQVVEEVVPFSEHLGAIGVSAAEKSDYSSGFWRFVLIDDKILGAWNMLLNSNLV